jgi:ubiquinone/menaquinone biosynthesis C-methylase UbiE
MRSNMTTRTTYDRLSRWYDLISGRSEKRLTYATLERLSPKNGETVLEIGPGTGHALVHLAQAVEPSGKVYGLDLSPGMLQVARQRVQRAEQAAMVHLIRGDGTSLPFPAGYFDAILISFTLELFDEVEIPVVLAECWRVLKMSARLGVVSLSRQGGVSWMVRAYDWIHRKYPTLVDCRPIQVSQALEQIGFSVEISELRSLWGLPVEVVIAERK